MSDHVQSNKNHGISNDEISHGTHEVVKTLQLAGYQAYLVGGGVRDLLLGTHPKDFDVATDAIPEQVKSLFRRGRIIGRRFRLVHVRVGREVIEVATFRAAPDQSSDDQQHRTSDDGQVLRDNQYGSREQDAIRRDFTVNALYYDPVSMCLIDDVGGLDDLKSRVLRSLGDPIQRFREDPVRMLRAVRFTVKLGFKPDQAVVDATKELAPLLRNVAPARMFDEALKLFHGGHALQTYLELRETGLFEYLFPDHESINPNSKADLVELALKNTDLRVQQGKPVIAAFLFSAVLWRPTQDHALNLHAQGVLLGEAWRDAAFDVLQRQSPYLLIPRRIFSIVREIWAMQARLEARRPRSVPRLLGSKRFRAAYDFLVLRSRSGEVDIELANWWTEIQELGENQQRAMVRSLGGKPAGRRRRRKSKRPSKQS